MNHRHDVSTCFDRGLARLRRPLLPLSGSVCVDEGGLQVQFSLDLDGAVIRQVAFKATTCVTLVAYSERLAERVTGADLRSAVRLRPEDLAGELDGVPPIKQLRAALPVRALHSAIHKAIEENR